MPPEVFDALRRQVNELVDDQALRDALKEERTLVERTHDLARELRDFRKEELRRFWPAVWRRWAVALMFALLAAGMFGVGYELARRPDAAKLTALRSRVELLDYVAERLLKMTPAERREFDALMKWPVRR